jgi:hypothetical protein
MKHETKQKDVDVYLCHELYSNPHIQCYELAGVHGTKYQAGDLLCSPDSQESSFKADSVLPLCT